METTFRNDERQANTLGLLGVAGEIQAAQTSILDKANYFAADLS